MLQDLLLTSFPRWYVGGHANHMTGVAGTLCAVIFSMQLRSLHTDQVMCCVRCKVLERNRLDYLLPSHEQHFFIPSASNQFP